MLIQALRKAPTAGGVGFRQATQKLATVVQLLMGELPDRSLFRQAEYAVALQPYLELAQALRIGDLAAYTQVVTTHAAVFETDDTTSLVQRYVWPNTVSHDRLWLDSQRPDWGRRTHNG